MKKMPFHIKAVLFDFDGTLTKPDNLDLSVIKSPIGCPSDMPYLEFIKDFPPEKKEKAMTSLTKFELNAALKSEPNSGAEAIIRYVRSKGILVGILSNNTRQSIEISLQNFEYTGISDFDLIISRDDPANPKPSGDGILLAAQKLNVDVNQILMVGDYILDIQASRKAGSISVFLDIEGGREQGAGSRGQGTGCISHKPCNENLPSATCDLQSVAPNWRLLTREASISESDFTISHLDELKDVIRMGIPLFPGKFPNSLLKGALEQFAFNDPSILINAGIGEDIAAVDVNNEEVIVLKSDPITFATDSIGHYAVLINANDIATSGADPRWLLTTLLFPCGTTGSEVFQVMYDLKEVCQKWGITLCGGHTEITDAVTRPVVIGMLAGTVAKSRLIDKRNMKKGDKILLTKGVAVEGTSIIAREFGDRLKNMGMSENEIEECRDFLSHISILKEAQIARQSPGTSAMHDITEGGIATALEELSFAGNHKIMIDMDKIPIFFQTEKICRLLNINPLGLIGSGSLLICCRGDYCEKLLRDIRKSDTDVSVIGEVTEEGEGIEAKLGGNPVEWIKFEVDEITRLF